MPIARHLTYIRGEADRAQFHPCAAAGTGGCARGAGCGRDELAVQFEQRPLLRGVVVVIGGDARSDGDEHGCALVVGSSFRSSGVRFVFMVAVPPSPIVLFFIASFLLSFQITANATHSTLARCVRTMNTATRATAPYFCSHISHSSTSGADTSGWNHHRPSLEHPTRSGGCRDRERERESCRNDGPRGGDSLAAAAGHRARVA